jgi:hypothetical protein
MVEGDGGGRWWRALRAPFVAVRPSSLANVVVSPETYRCTVSAHIGCASPGSSIANIWPALRNRSLAPAIEAFRGLRVGVCTAAPGFRATRSFQFAKNQAGGSSPYQVTLQSAISRSGVSENESESSAFWIPRSLHRLRVCRVFIQRSGRARHCSGWPHVGQRGRYCSDGGQYDSHDRRSRDDHQRGRWCNIRRADHWFGFGDLGSRQQHYGWSRYHGSGRLEHGEFRDDVWARRQHVDHGWNRWHGRGLQRHFWRGVLQATDRVCTLPW